MLLSKDLFYHLQNIICCWPLEMLHYLTVIQVLYIGRLLILRHTANFSILGVEMGRKSLV